MARITRERYDRMVELQQQGLEQEAIGADVGTSPRTVRRYLNGELPPPERTGTARTADRRRRTRKPVAASDSNLDEASATARGDVQPTGQADTGPTVQPVSTGVRTAEVPAPLSDADL